MIFLWHVFSAPEWGEFRGDTKLFLLEFESIRDWRQKKQGFVAFYNGGRDF